MGWGLEQQNNGKKTILMDYPGIIYGPANSCGQFFSSSSDDGVEWLAANVFHGVVVMTARAVQQAKIWFGFWTHLQCHDMAKFLAVHLRKDCGSTGGSSKTLRESHPSDSDLLPSHDLESSQCWLLLKGIWQQNATNRYLAANNQVWEKASTYFFHTHVFFL